jgi:hypothetical protein
MEVYIKPPPGSRFNVLDAPVALPGYCTICRASQNDGRKYLDIGFDLDWYGAVYFCGFCLTEAMGYLGWHSPEEYSKVISDNERLVQKVDELEAENVKLRAALHNLDFLGINVSERISDPFVLPEINDEESSEGNESDESVNSGEGENIPQSVRQINESGREDVLINEQSNESADREGQFNLGLE